MFWIHVETCYIMGDYFMRSRTTSLSCDLRPVTEISENLADMHYFE